MNSKQSIVFAGASASLSIWFWRLWYVSVVKLNSESYCQMTDPTNMYLFCELRHVVYGVLGQIFTLLAIAFLVSSYLATKEKTHLS